MIAKADYIAGAAKSLAVLQAFDVHRQKLNASQAADKAGLTRAAARRHLLTLEHLGYLESRDGYFWLTPKVLALSGSYLATARLPRLVQPGLNRLSALTGQSYSVVVRDGDEVVVVARSVASQQQRLLVAHGLHLGARLSLTATSTGRVLLAGEDPKTYRRWAKTAHLARMTMHTQVDPGAFDTMIAQVRKDGYCLAEQEHELGVQALAIALHDSRGKAVAAMNVVAQAGQTDSRDFVAKNLPLMRETAAIWQVQWSE